MTGYLGFEPELTGERYFVSNKNEDAERIGGIACCLHEMGVRMWYDRGIESGAAWNPIIRMLRLRQITRRQPRNFGSFRFRVLWVRTLVSKECMRLAETARKAENHVRTEEHADVTGSKKQYGILGRRRNSSDMSKVVVNPFLETAKRKKRILLGAIGSFLVLTVVFGIIFIPKYFTNKKAERYDRSVSLVKKGDYIAASELLEGLDYGDSEWLQSAIKDVEHQHQLSKIESGTYYVFGAYEQDNNSSNGKEDIEWLVLAKEDNRILVTNRFALDCQPYNDDDGEVTWETCTLRTWLNDTFLNEAFNEKEQEMILAVTDNADANPSDDTDLGNSTTDKTFLLSIEEVEEFFLSTNARKCIPTPYAIAKGAGVGHVHKNLRWLSGAGFWWLRSSGYDSHNAESVGKAAVEAAMERANAKTAVQETGSVIVGTDAVTRLKPLLRSTMLHMSAMMAMSCMVTPLKSMVSTQFSVNVLFAPLFG